MLIDKGLFSGKATLFKVHKVQLTEDVEAYIRQISLADYTRITSTVEERKTSGHEDSFELPVQMIMASLCDEFGHKIFSMEDRDRVLELLPMGIIIKLATEITNFNNLTSTTPAQAVASEVKNSTGIPSADSYSVYAES
jgi:hypothetical protein